MAIRGSSPEGRGDAFCGDLPRRRLGFVCITVVMALLVALQLKPSPGLAIKSLTQESRADGLSQNNKKVPTALGKNMTNWLIDHATDYAIQPPKTPGAYIHIGKAGGSTISHQLLNGCHSFVKKPCKEAVPYETRISQLTTYYHIPDFRKEAIRTQPYEFFVISLIRARNMSKKGFSKNGT